MATKLNQNPVKHLRWNFRGKIKLRSQTLTNIIEIYSWPEQF